MNLEEQVCSLELAKKLKEIGVNQNSIFYYVNAKSVENYKFPDETWMIAHLSQMTALVKDSISAFTVAELGEMLPAYININGDICLLELSKYIIPIEKQKGKIKYSSEYFVREDNHYKLATGLYEEKEADARAKMIIYLIENNLVKVRGND